MATVKHEMQHEKSIMKTSCFNFYADARILVGPENHMVPLESYVNFSCIAEGFEPSWFINGEIVDETSETDFIEDGFEFLHSRFRSAAGYNHTLTMSVWASLQNNNTVINCRVHGTGPADISSSAKLIVMGMQCY